MADGLEVAVGGGSQWRAPCVRDAPLLLLDEPTANLDTVTERELLACVWEAARRWRWSCGQVLVLCSSKCLKIGWR